MYCVYILYVFVHILYMCPLAPEKHTKATSSSILCAALRQSPMVLGYSSSTTHVHPQTVNTDTSISVSWPCRWNRIPFRFCALAPSLTPAALTLVYLRRPRSTSLFPTRWHVRKTASSVNHTDVDTAILSRQALVWRPARSCMWCRTFAASTRKTQIVEHHSSTHKRLLSTAATNKSSSFLRQSSGLCVAGQLHLD